MSDVVDQALRGLPRSEREVLERTLGVRRAPESLEGVAAAMGVTRERVRTLLRRALAQLRDDPAAAEAYRQLDGTPPEQLAEAFWQRRSLLQLLGAVVRQEGVVCVDVDTRDVQVQVSLSSGQQRALSPQRRAEADVIDALSLLDVATLRRALHPHRHQILGCLLTFSAAGVAVVGDV